MNTYNKHSRQAIETRYPPPTNTLALTQQSAATATQAQQVLALAPEIKAIAKQLDAVKSGRGFANLAFLKKHGLIQLKRKWLHTSSYSRPTGQTIIELTAKGQMIHTAANRIALTT